MPKPWRNDRWRRGPRTAASVVEEMASGAPMVADYLKSAGEKVDRLSTDLREKKISELLDAAVGFGRAQPVLMLASRSSEIGRAHV